MSENLIDKFEELYSPQVPLDAYKGYTAEDIADMIVQVNPHEPAGSALAMGRAVYERLQEHSNGGAE